MPALSSPAQHVLSTAKDLGVILEWNLTLKSHVKRLAQSCFFHLRNVSRSGYLMIFGDASMHFITSHLDYFNAVFRLLGKIPML